MKQIIWVIAAIIAVGLVLTLVERLFPARRETSIFRRAYWLDLQYLVFAPTIGKLITRASIVLAILPTYWLVLGHLPDRETLLRGFGPVAAQPFWLQAIELLLIADFIGYWTHRLFHGRSWGGRLWKIHAVHHSSEDLDWLSSVRVHPLNEAIGAVLRTVPLVLLGFSTAAVAGLAPLLALHALLLHANVDWDFGRLRMVISSPVFHRWHHSRDRDAIDRNFAGLFPVWDLIFGTYYMPRERRPCDFGVHEPTPDTLWGQLAYPFRWEMR